MRSRPCLWVLAVCAWSLLAACGSGARRDPDGSPPPGSDSTPAVTEPGATGPVTEVPPASTDPLTPPDEPGPAPPPAPPPAPEFQPAFHQALRWSKSVSGLTTFRMRIPVGRAGERLRITFRSGDGSL